MLPIVVITCCMTFGPTVVVGNLHFTMLRLLVLIGCARLIIRKEMRSIQWLRLDTVMLLWILAGTLAYTLLWQSWDALTNRLGIAYDAVGLYLIFRAVIRDIDDIVRTCKLFAVLLAPVAACMLVEKLSGRNFFHSFGGVPEFTEIRDGVLRCQGPFLHPILAGTFGAVWLPMFVGLWWHNRKNRIVAAIGILSSTVITLASGSSGPLAAYMAGVLACMMWPMRRKMRLIRWSIGLGVVLLSLVMKDPVWFIFARINIFSASTGWHRANLLDKTIRHFFDWWLVGVKNTEVWGVWWGDITNQFILQGVRGGLVTFLLFVYIVVLAFSAIGRTLAGISGETLRSRKFVWAVGCTLFSHVIAFQDVAYFDQNFVNWYWLLAAVATIVTAYAHRKKSSRIEGSRPNEGMTLLATSQVEQWTLTMSTRQSF